jgi:hypothetical protein
MGGNEGMLEVFEEQTFFDIGICKWFLLEYFQI